MLADIKNCAGCKTCELVCSFKHLGEFAPSFSSIRIIENKYGGGYQLKLLEEPDGKGLACDGCQELQEPLCIQFCGEKEELEKIIAAYIRKRKPASTPKKESYPVRLRICE